MKTKLLTIFGVMALSAFAVVALPDTASAQSGNTSQPQTSSTSTTANYTYVAQPGDSYSVLARKAIQTYGIETKTNLSGAQIVFAETGLTQAAGSPVLLTGQTVAISKNDVKAWVDKAKALTPAQITAWNYYVPFVDFNTNGNGQAS